MLDLDTSKQTFLEKFPLPYFSLLKNLKQSRYRTHKSFKSSLRSSQNRRRYSFDR